MTDASPTAIRSLRRSHQGPAASPQVDGVPTGLSTRRAARQLSSVSQHATDAATAAPADRPPLRRPRPRQPAYSLAPEPSSTLVEAAIARWDAADATRNTPELVPTPVWDAVIRRPRPKPVAPPGAKSPQRAIFKPPPPPLPPAPLLPLVDGPAPAPPVRHARRRGAPIRLSIAAVAAAALLLGSSSAVTSAVTGGPLETTASERAIDDEISTSLTSRDAIAVAPPPTIASLAAAPEPAPTPAPAPVDVCAIPAVVAALQAGDDAATIAAAGGPAAFRAAVASGAAPCVNLADPARVWVVIDKIRPLDPVDYAPASLTAPEGLRVVEGRLLRPDAAAAMSALGSAAAQSGVGEIGLDSAYRSYDTQVTSYGSQVANWGTAEADLVSARPGYSEHQLGLAADVVACSGECGTLDDVGGSPQGQWLAEHAWEYGWIVRYEDGHTAVTGYSPEPWHLRYIGVELAREYHDGGWHTLEEFFGLPAAPGYAG